MDESVPNNPKLIICSKCGTDQDLDQVTLPRDPLKTKIIICGSCPFYQCQTCQTWTTISGPSSWTCFCKKVDVCLSCIKKHQRTDCPNCHLYQPFVCSEACKQAALDYLKEKSEICGFCGVVRHCLHTMAYDRNVNPDPFMMETSNYCCYQPDLDGDYCKKWICPGCIDSSLLTSGIWVKFAGFYCQEHFKLMASKSVKKEDSAQ